MTPDAERLLSLAVLKGLIIMDVLFITVTVVGDWLNDDSPLWFAIVVIVGCALQVASLFIVRRQRRGAPAELR